MPSELPTNATSPRRRWNQFSLRMLLVLMFVVSVCCAWLALRVQRLLEKRRTVETLISTGARVTFHEPRSVVERMEWLRAAVGDAALLQVKSVELISEPEYLVLELIPARTRLNPLKQPKYSTIDQATFSDAGLEQLRKLKGLELLNLGYSRVTDVGLEHLTPLTQLNSLYLAHLPLTSSGLRHLRELTDLETLDLDGTRIDDAGLEHLSNMTKLEWLHLSGTQITDDEEPFR